MALALGYYGAEDRPHGLGHAMDFANMSQEEILALAKEQGVELSDEQLDKIAGGDVWGETQALISRCPYCGSDQLEFGTKSGDTRIYRCKSCNLLCID